MRLNRRYVLSAFNRYKVITSVNMHDCQYNRILQWFVGLVQAKDLEIQLLRRQIHFLLGQLKEPGEGMAKDDVIVTLKDELEKANVWHSLLKAQRT